MLCHLAAFQYCKLYDGRTLTIYPENRKKENQINQQKMTFRTQTKTSKMIPFPNSIKKRKKTTLVAIRNQ